MVIAFVYALLGDNPMQSKLASHIGLRGKLFCRVCYVKGSDIEALAKTKGKNKKRNTNDGMEQDIMHTNSNTNSALSVASDMSVEKGVGSGGTKAQCTKRTETVTQMFERVLRFMKVIPNSGLIMLCFSTIFIDWCAETERGHYRHNAAGLHKLQNCGREGFGREIKN